MSIETVLVTGGSGYIGSHTVLQLLVEGYNVIVVDNLSNSSYESIRRVKEISGKDVIFFNCDLCNQSFLNDIFVKNNIDFVIHFAGSKAVSESVSSPLSYYNNNIKSTLSLLEAMQINDVKKLVFSSSATVYGSLSSIPYVESNPTGMPSSPYGNTKLIIEQILSDLSYSDDSWSFVSLRYFNPVGAHPSGLIGEDPCGIPNNLFPFITKVGVGLLDHLNIFGSDYDTPDGTCRRDFIHVMDVAKGHLSALKYTRRGHSVFNLGSGKPVSVLEIVHAFKEFVGVDIPHLLVEPRSGDLPEFWACPDKAYNELGWMAERSLRDMVVDAWNWQVNNPTGYNL